jgi:hypothetical protein
MITVHIQLQTFAVRLGQAGVLLSEIGSAVMEFGGGRDGGWESMSARDKSVFGKKKAT